ncbi:hypothetical protein [Acetobacterium woodii]|uniref:Membrane protein permease n=1 Tax=Acetobacterium woodii (strain ATCC 29683 / DSM 1030 / JCM 2381 / KCTC 1655 / WB1) TaxID=931626 RepID=H6LHD9_ACEWD|nr:hypothetical protein [Acetobacterium woodii]AFA49649.1 membrane protein permease [Acetobacterium woodii DSM 1030]
MKSNAIYKFQLAEHKKSTAIFCLVILVILAFIPIYNELSLIFQFQNSSTIYISGLDIAPAVFLFICGLSAFKDNFRMALQNGISRKSLFVNRIYVVLTLAVAMALFDQIVMILGKAVASLSANINYSGILEQIYGSQFTTQSGGFLTGFESFLFLIILFITFLSLGYLIAVGLYRLDKKQKVACIVGFYMVAFVIFPLIDMFMASQLSTILYQFLDFVMGISAQNPLIGIFSLVIFSLILNGLTWLFIGKAEVKN